MHSLMQRSKPGFFAKLPQEEGSVTTSNSRHDRLVVSALADSTLRLLSAEWLRNRPAGFVLARRQELPDEAFVSSEHARSLFEAHDRRVGALSYGWLTPLHSDPHGLNAANVIAFLRLDLAGRRIQALFWDVRRTFIPCPLTPRSPSTARSVADCVCGPAMPQFASMPQKDEQGVRSPEENELFERGLK
jgi:hypothetical protein